MSGRGSGVGSDGGGTSSSRRTPAGTIEFERSGAPSSVSRPSEISRWTKLRDRPERSAAIRSARDGRASGATTSTRDSPVPPGSGIRPSGSLARERGPRARGDEQENRERDRGIRDVEGPEAEAPDAGV